MTAEIREVLSKCISDPPDELVQLFTAPPLQRKDLRIRLRDLNDAVAYTQAIHERSLIGKPMELFALDDASDSNPFCYISRGVAQGCILHLYHDDTPSIEYSSLAAFLNALNDAIEHNRDIGQISGKELRPRIDQRQLCDRIESLAKSNTNDAQCELIVLSKLLAADSAETIRLLAGHSSYFVREGAAALIASYPSPDVLDVAEALTKDSHMQVARAGRKAFSAVKRVALASKK